MTKPQASPTEPTHYQVLSLPRAHPAASPLTEANLKLAYHKALFVHHPDKVQPNPKRSQYTVDEIKLAYFILSNQSTRADYDHSLLISLRKASKLDGGVEPAGEILDLDELAYDEEKETWYRSCRCGQERGFVVTEPDLERAAEEGEKEGEKEVVTGCTGCSLWIRVLFGVVDAG